MARRPWPLTLLAWTLVLIAISMPVQVMWLYGHDLSEVNAIWAKLTWVNLLVLVSVILNAALVWRVSSTLRYSIPFSIGLVTLNNLIVGYYATDFSLWGTSFATLAFCGLHSPLLSARVRWILRHPEQRWWLRAERRRLTLPLLIEGMRLNAIKAESFDISETGAFITGARELGVGDWINVKVGFDSLAQIRCRARVVRRGEAAGPYPAGVGVEFVDLTWRQRRDLRRRLDRVTH